MFVCLFSALISTLENFWEIGNNLKQLVDEPCSLELGKAGEAASANQEAADSLCPDAVKKIIEEQEHLSEQVVNADASA